MKASYRWLRALVPQLTATPKELAARFTGAGLEVEAMHSYGEGTEACVIAKVTSSQPHPSRSGLTLVTVDRGGALADVGSPGGSAGSPLTVVCGAPNVPPPGSLVVLAPLGAHLPAKKMTIERRAIAGVTSEGMLCSESELGLTEEAAGILVLPEDMAPPGTPLTKALPACSDTIFEIALTPNRPDGLGHLGLAREAAALYGLPWGPPEPDAPSRAIQGKVESYAKVVLEDPERCPHYGAAVVVDVTVGPSPLWLRYRLSSLGVRPISNVVDVTNLVLLEYGHPMHAFDLDLVRGQTIVVRRARDGEKLRTLDGVEHALVTDDLILCDAEGPVGLAGVMGGASSEIRAETKRVLLECAYFEPRGVRRAARRHGLHTEASHRFERGVDPGDVPEALTHAAALLTHLAKGAAVPGAIHALGKPIESRIVHLRSRRLDALLGVAVPFSEAVAILVRLGLTLRSQRDGVAELVVPSHRPDITREVDLVEEVARVRGMEAIPTVLPAVRPSRDEGPRESILRRVRQAATELGLSEAVVSGFVSRAALEAIGAPAPSVVLKNPLSALQEVMRTSLLPGLFDALIHARRHGERDLRMFTTGALFLPSASHALPEERLAFAAILAGDRPAYLTKPEAVDVWDAKGLAEGLIRRLLGRSTSLRVLGPDERPPWLHPRGAAEVLVEGTAVGTLGPVHPDVVDRCDLGGGAIVVEFDLAALDRLGRLTPTFVPIPRFPASTRDVALVVQDNMTAGHVEAAVRAAAGDLAEAVSLFDRFAGGAIPEAHRSLAFRVVYRAKDRTLTDAEVDAQHDRVVAALKGLGASLRQ
jgi:phenylalanyl-tRNA synthetase beta chain